MKGIIFNTTMKNKFNPLSYFIIFSLNYYYRAFKHAWTIIFLVGKELGV